MVVQSRRVQPRKPQQLLVEGQDDQHIVWHLCEQHQPPETFDVVRPGTEVESGGIEILIDELLNDLPVRLRQGSLQTLGIMVDADSDPQRQWERLKRVVPAPIGAIMPTFPIVGGWIGEEVEFFSTPIRVGIWLMPDGNSVGMLEDFAASLIREDDALINKARAVLNEVEQIVEAESQRYTVNHRPKALIHTWLAWQRNPGRPMGTAIKAGYLRHDAPTALAFVTWLRRLFDPTTSPQAV
jgi:hypothetical protein